MGKRILIADDEQDIKDVMEMFLDAQGYEVETAYDGLDALDRARTWMPDAILLDIMMPVMDGIDVCRQLKADEKTKAIPIIMVSAASKREKESEAFEAGASDYILKPFEPPDLIQILEKHLGDQDDGI
jgi:two-component system alkaline phosphatase synthesis response regulator PhoP